nr:MAG TPA: hypothetical protein [Caudoviricetes sp.]
MSVTCHLQGKQQNGIIRVQNKNKTNRLLESATHFFKFLLMKKNACKMQTFFFYEKNSKNLYFYTKIYL